MPTLPTSSQSDPSRDEEPRSPKGVTAEKHFKFAADMQDFTSDDVVSNQRGFTQMLEGRGRFVKDSKAAVARLLGFSDLTEESQKTTSPESE